MSDLISRNALCEYCLNTKDKTIDANDIMRFPSAEPERKIGFWKDYGSGEWHCSECGLDVLTEGSWVYPESRNYNYCPHCGADMRGD